MSDNTYGRAFRPVRGTAKPTGGGMWYPAKAGSTAKTEQSRRSGDPEERTEKETKK